MEFGIFCIIFRVLNEEYELLRECSISDVIREFSGEVSVVNVYEFESVYSLFSF